MDGPIVQASQTIVLVTHNPQGTEHARWTLRMRDGRLDAANTEPVGTVR
jgi:ABC-type lipoprotein export system ATPase subunit